MMRRIYDWLTGWTLVPTWSVLFYPVIVIWLLVLLLALASRGGL